MKKNKVGGRKPRDDNALFRAAMSDTKPLNRRNKGYADEPPSPQTAAARRTFTPQKTAAVAPVVPPARPLKAGAAADLDRRTMERLRKGRLRPEARLDLHGMTASRAYDALNEFVAQAHGAGNRCILVITGKGALKKGGGVIRRELPAWLNAPENRPRILGFAQAQPTDGGGGAFYILLKRQR
ncbi:MAG: Smr/MutS family protein [Pseudomonadota bacterium]|nr:Smr/MutS family protein [Pseudomonadota bacterium]